MHVDITDKKRDQQSLLQFAAAMDATVDAIYLIDRAEMALSISTMRPAGCRTRRGKRLSQEVPVPLLGIPARRTRT
jgi:PAS domain-containing protein